MLPREFMLAVLGAMTVVITMGTAMMLRAYIDTGNPIALFDMIWGIALIVWAVWLAKGYAKRRN